MKLVIRKGLGYVFYVMVLCFFLNFFFYVFHVHFDSYFEDILRILK